MSTNRLNLFGGKKKAPQKIFAPDLSTWTGQDLVRRQLMFHEKLVVNAKGVVSSHQNKYVSHAVHQQYLENQKRYQSRQKFIDVRPLQPRKDSSSTSPAPSEQGQDIKLFRSDHTESTEDVPGFASDFGAQLLENEKYSTWAISQMMPPKNNESNTRRPASASAQSHSPSNRMNRPSSAQTHSPSHRVNRPSSAQSQEPPRKQSRPVSAPPSHNGQWNDQRSQSSEAQQPRRRIRRPAGAGQGPPFSRVHKTVGLNEEEMEVFQDFVSLLCQYDIPNMCRLVEDARRHALWHMAEIEQQNEEQEESDEDDEEVPVF
mmetsp:Transcript_33500/g.76569  ORF Transcript_33500/g.76569 Transcript_33500/m.76569 type:complete len:316 (+) Transcript_33500:36-983(+)|eukprot:CAMPEP_0114556574 /NCGR_PEP_ID=MMETSP0114-20121206/9362_1 /TAXON_ID=31324 /ORGANISM="Goniomonas sp, Strain m" /LENGTH=315 /DNA_ID=CAMNT_0001741789 /DNA_START=11 /DNA_END=958 /DNA_ORIENTATION=-